MVLTREELNVVVADGNFDALISQVENAWFDAKAQPYQLDDAGKRDLARDVAALANTMGGVLAIGARTVPSALHFGEEVAEIRPFQQSLVNTSQYQHILDGWIYPRVQDLVIEWVPSVNDTTRGIVVIRVPQQRDDLGPFLVVKSLSGAKVVETLFGYAERRGDTNSPLTIVDIQRALRAGLRYERTLEQRFDGIETVLRDLRAARETPRSNALEQKLAARVERSIADAQLTGERLFTMAVYPDAVDELQTVFLATDESIRRRLERPPVLRYAGWDLTTRGVSEIVEGEFIRVRTARKVVDLYRDGTMVFACLANEDFLAWTSKIEKLHPLAVVEVIYSVVAFYEFVLDDFREVPAAVTFRLELRNLHKDETKTSLGPYTLNSIAQMFDDELRPAPKNETVIVKQFQTDSFVPARVAYELVKEIYLWFGFEEGKIPYAQGTGAARVIDLDAIPRK